MDDFYIEIVGDRRLLQNIEQLPDTVKEILREKVFTWMNKLEDQVIQNIRDRLKTQTGTLVNSVRQETIDEGNRIDGHVHIDAPYAAAQDRGAVTPPHIIRARNGKLLAFIAATGDKVMATKVSHPGGIIPATHYAKDAYSLIAPQISRGIKNAVVEGIRRKMRE
jgi:hypothetical protein